jgi:positive regulator of sigma E activity
LTVKAAVCAVFGLQLLFVPSFLLELLGTTVGDGGTVMARAYGAALLGTLVLTWFARNAAESEARQPILLDLLVYDAIGLVVMLVAVLSGVLNALAWGIVFVYLFFSVGSGYLLRKRAIELKEQPAVT